MDLYYNEIIKSIIFVMKVTLVFHEGKKNSNVKVKW